MTNVSHHQHYQYGEGSEEHIPGTYQKAWFWESPETMPYSQNYHAPWEKAFPSREVISDKRLEHFKANATPISKEEYDRLLKRKADIQAADDKREYMWDRNPWSYMDDED